MSVAVGPGYRDGTRSKIDCSATNKSRERSLGHAVYASAREGGADSGIATDENDPASVFHFLDGCLNTDEGGTDVDGHHAVKVLDTVAIDCAHGENAGIDDKDVERAESLCCSQHSGAELSGRGAVRL